MSNAAPVAGPATAPENPQSKPEVLEVIATYRDGKQSLFTFEGQPAAFQSEAGVLALIFQVTGQRSAGLVKLSLCLYQTLTPPRWLVINNGKYYFGFQ